MVREHREAILIPANPRDLETPALGSVLLHAIHAERYGKVFWDVFPPTQDRPGPFPHQSIRVAYFYDVIDRLVRYKAKLHAVLSGRELSKLKNGKRFLLRHRRGYYNAGSWGYWVLLSEFSELESPVKLHKLRLARTGRPVGNVRRYAIVQDQRLKPIR